MAVEPDLAKVSLKINNRGLSQEILLDLGSRLRLLILHVLVLLLELGDLFGRVRSRLLGLLQLTLYLF